jgi:hypothetical protein
VRDSDCLHLAGRGGDLYAREVLFALQELWGRDTPEGGLWSRSESAVWPQAEPLDGWLPRGF